MIVFIDTHGRPDNQYTYETLMSRGYKGKIVFVVDDEDDTVDKLRQNYTDNDIQMFHKQYYYERVDAGVNNPKRKLNLFARCACEDIAKKYNCESFVMADDDILDFRYRYKEDGSLKSQKIETTADEFIQLYSEFMIENDFAMISTGMPQMYFAGADIDSTMWKWRVPFNFVFRNAKYDINWVSSFEEECVTTVNSLIEGKNCMCVPLVQHTINPLAEKKGGMFDAYHSSTPFELAEFGHIFHPTVSEPYYYSTKNKSKWMSKTKRETAFPRIISSSYKLL